MSDDSLLTTEEMLDYLQVNLRTMYRLIRAGKIPAVRVGRQWRFRKRDIDSWIKTQSVGTAAPESEAQAPPRKKSRILLVDDEEGIRELIAKALELADYDVDAVSNGLIAVERLRQSGYDLLITDLKMPELDGLNVVRAAKQAQPGLPTVIITAHSTESTAIEALNLGVSGYLLKPFHLAEVLTVTAKALGG